MLLSTPKLSVVQTITRLTYFGVTLDCPVVIVFFRVDVVDPPSLSSTLTGSLQVVHGSHTPYVDPGTQASPASPKKVDSEIRQITMNFIFVVLL